jgi:hypothetical protein
MVTFWLRRNCPGQLSEAVRQVLLWQPHPYAIAGDIGMPPCFSDVLLLAGCDERLEPRKSLAHKIALIGQHQLLKRVA